MKKIIAILSSFIFLSTVSYGQLTISEYSASNLDINIDNNGKFEDWIEIHNTSDMSVDASGWYLSDKEDKPTKWMIPEGATIAANGYLLFLCSGRDKVIGNEYHTNFKLSQTSGKDEIVLSNPDGEIVEAHSMIITQMNHSVCKDLSLENTPWKISTDPRPGLWNDPVDLILGYTQAPKIMQTAGFYTDSIVVVAENIEPNSIMRYTTDGTEVLSTSPEYAGPIKVTETTLVKVRSFTPDSLNLLPGNMDFATFFINEDFSLPVFSVGADQVKDLANGNGDLFPIGSVEYFNTDKERESYSYGELNRHGKDSWSLPHRSLDYICRDEMGYTKAIGAKLFDSRDRDEYQRLMFRASGDDNYPAVNDANHRGSAHVRDEYVHTLAAEGGMKLDVRTVKRAILFLNGEYWGVYGLREKIADHDYIGEYYDQGKYDIQFLSTWGFTNSIYGGQTALDDWMQLQNFILTQNMGLEENYAAVDSQLNIVSHIDWMLINTNTVAADWLQWNTGWWRGMDPEGDHKKWGYIVWDLDATFDYYINYTGVPNTNPDADPCDIEVLSTWVGDSRHNDIFVKLYNESPTFRELFYQRYADMMNTVFSCDNMLSLLDRMIDVIDPEMDRQIDRWGGSRTEWENNVDKLRGFIEERCTLLDDGALECYSELNGLHEVVLQTSPEGVGEIDFNSIDIEEFPWSGSYFGDMVNKIKTKAFDEYEDEYFFSHWESKNGNIVFEDSINRKTTMSLIGTDTLVAVYTDMTTSIEELEGDTRLVVYPNPAQNYLMLNYNLTESSAVSWELSSTVGDLVASQRGMNKSSGIHEQKIDLSGLNLSAGVYLLTMKVNNGVLTRRVTVI